MSQNEKVFDIVNAPPESQGVGIDPNIQSDPLIVFGPNQSPLVTVLQDATVVVHKQPPDEAMREAAMIFWHEIQVHGQSLIHRIADLENKLEMVKLTTDGFKRTVRKRED